MSRLYRILTLRDLGQGLRIYGRISAPFCVYAFFFFFGGWATIKVIDWDLPPSILRRFPQLFQHPTILNSIIEVFFLAALGFCAYKLAHFTEHKLHSNELRSHFGLLAYLDRINRGLIVFSGAVISYLLRTSSNEGRWVCISLLIVLIMALLISISLFGWFLPQFEEKVTR